MNLVTSRIDISLARLPDLARRGFKVPAYDPANVKIGIVHIGPGHFFASHLANIIDDYMGKTGDLYWGIAAISIRQPDSPEKILQKQAARKAIEAQDNLYTLTTRAHGKSEFSIIGSVRQYLAAYDSTESAQKIMDLLCAETTKVVSLTITPGAYKSAEFTDSLQNPNCWAGYCLKALLMRREKRDPLFDILSCDNKEGNGDLAKKCIIDLAKKLAPDSVVWLQQNLVCPNTVVDRITPDNDVGTRDYLLQKTNVYDAAPILAEPHRGFIIQSDSRSQLPDLGTVGAVYVENALPHNDAKIWLLNGTHRAAGYIGFLLGYGTSDQVLNPQSKLNGHFAAFIAGLMDEIIGILPNQLGWNDEQKQDFASQIIRRFQNPDINDPLTRLCRDGTSKFPARILDPIRLKIAADQSFKKLAFVTAAWIRYASGQKLDGTVFNTGDTDGEKKGFTEAAKNVLEAFEAARDKESDIVISPSLKPVLAFRDVFGDLAENMTFVEAVTTAYASIVNLGLPRALAQATWQPPKETTGVKLTVDPKLLIKAGMRTKVA